MNYTSALKVQISCYAIDNMLRCLSPTVAAITLIVSVHRTRIRLPVIFLLASSNALSNKAT